MENFVLSVRKGGLGNQLFQVAAAIVYQEEKGKTVLIPKEHYNHHNTQKQEYADIFFRRFPHRIDIAFDDNAVNYFLQTNFTKHSTNPGFDAWTPEDSSGNILLHGYFQYYPPIERHESLIREIYLEGCRNLLPNYQPSKDLVGIHIRRGDYLKHPHSETMPSPPLSYYEKALEYFSKDTMFCIFSDDLEWCRQQKIFQDLPKKVFIDEPDECTCLAVMTMCHGGFICANSTFSWWGAFLGAHSSRQPVFVPAVWYKGETLDLFPKEWIHL
jgi:hypothetical protein